MSSFGVTSAVTMADKKTTFTTNNPCNKVMTTRRRDGEENNYIYLENLTQFDGNDNRTNKLKSQGKRAIALFLQA